MGELFTPLHLIFLLLLACFFFLLPAIFYILTLQRALSKCAPGYRTLEPGLVWLYLIPLVNLVFSFFIVLGLSNSLRNEFHRRGIPLADPNPGQSVGLAMAICACCAWLPVLGVIAVLAHIVLWIIYWVKIAEYSRALDYQPQIGFPAPIG